MIKLIDILKEITLQKGSAGNDSSRYILGTNLYDLIGDKTEKYEDLDDDEKINSLVQPLIKDILAKNKSIGESGEYKLVLSKNNYEYIFYLLNTKSLKISELFVGMMKLQRGYSSYTYNPQKAFGLKTFQVHWSNVATEYRGKGFGKIMYTLVYQYISSIGAAMASDNMLFEGSSGMWRTYMPSIAKYFGVIIDDIILPVTKADVADTSLIVKSDTNSFIAMEEPPKLVRKIAYNVEGLSFAKGEYGIMDAQFQNVNDELDLNGPFGDYEDSYFMNVVEDSNSIKELLKKLSRTGDFSESDIKSAKSPKQLKCLIFAFKNAIIAVKEVGDRLVSVVI